MRPRISCATSALLVAAFVAALPTLAGAQEFDFAAQGERPLAVQRRQSPPAPAPAPAEVRAPDMVTVGEPAAGDVLSGKKPKSAASIALRDKTGDPVEPPVTEVASLANEPAAVSSPAKWEARKTTRKSRGAVRTAAADCELLMLVSRLRVALR